MLDQPELAVHESKLLRHHADHFARLPVDDQPPPDHGSVTADLPRLSDPGDAHRIVVPQANVLKSGSPLGR